MEYIGYGEDHDGWDKKYDIGYAWHIDNLIIYDKPKELMQFTKIANCSDCLSFKYQPQNERFDLCNRCKEIRTIKRPPQSWCYVEELS